MLSTESALPESLAAAWQTRASLFAQLHAESTNAYRLFQGSVEGWPGLTIDRYGDLVLVQSFHAALPEAAITEIRSFYAGVFADLPGLRVLYNDRSAPNSRITNPLPAEELAVMSVPQSFQELGVNYLNQGRHAGQDPWLFLDLRAARRRIMVECAAQPDQSLLNLFAYTCGIGVAAAQAGANYVVNVDFSEVALKIGKENAKLNTLSTRPRMVKSDAFAAMRQLAGIGQPARVRGKPMPPFPKLEPKQFDWVVLDPPRYAKSPFGVVDLVNDYAALFKPALGCTREGGSMICCNNVADVSRDAWLDQLDRSARKAGRSIREAEWIVPEADFPSRDDNPPLKIVLLRV